MDTGEEQQVREKVLKDSASSYLKMTSRENILTNTLGSHEHEVNSLYPSIIVKLRTGELILEEIETESTVNSSQLEKWRNLAALGHQFKLIVPFSKLQNAKDLTTVIPNITLQAYEIVDDKVHWFGQNS